MIMNEELLDSLMIQDTCPKCSVSWREIDDSLHEGITSENYQIARMIIENCKVCQLRFGKEIERLGVGK